MANITMNCKSGSYSGSKSEELRDFYDKEGKILSLTRKQMLEMCMKDPWSIVPVKVLEVDKVSQEHLDEIARRKALAEAK